MTKPGEVCVYQFKVVLRGVSPMIWRRILLRSDQTIADLHYTIQIAMGWSDSHLNRFHIHGKDYGVAHEGGIWFDDNPEKVPLAGFGFRLRERFLYEYDFDDLWEHDVRLEKVLPWKAGCVRFAPAGVGWLPRRIAAGRELMWNKAIRAGESGPMPESTSRSGVRLQRFAGGTEDTSAGIRPPVRCSTPWCESAAAGARPSATTASAAF
jgi:hypothetical protein